MIKPRILQSYNFTLKKDKDSRYNKAKNNNIIQKSKEQNQLKYFFNYIFSFDLFFIENC